MLTFPHFDPVIFRIGPVALRWYGLMYVIAFALVLFLGRRRIRQGLAPFDAHGLDDLLFYGMIGTILGGRLGYILFYQFDRYLRDPLAALRIWEGGMSFHGGLLGVITAMLLFARTRQMSFWKVADFVAPLVPLGLGAGRLGNFINGELWGRPSNVPWAMVFPDAKPPVPRHPSQLYELALEGLVLFTVLWLFSSRPRPVRSVSGLFLIGYGLIRFCVEFTRQPDAGLENLPLHLSMGQWLSWPMVVAGIVLFWSAYRTPGPAKVAADPAAEPRGDSRDSSPGSSPPSR